ncbi:hypothetical protein [Shinella sp.]|uniref:hypothetical protein n=1 Tax=Shinella sp. TaxID=1870904 RepID=UPI0029AA4135|nr:hypothetical protein [Shinella sp.]MDX3973307.1 hypothetical protein [Shinella sp.]
MPAAVVFDNLADEGMISASSSEILARPDRVQNEHVARRWRSLSAVDALVVDLGGLVTIDTASILGLTAVTARCRVSTIDPDGGDLFDSGVEAVSQAHRQAVFLLPAPVSARYVRFDLTSDAPYVEAGRVVTGLRSTFAYNFAYGWGFSYVDLSRRTRTRGGQTQVNRDNRYRTLEVAFDFINKVDRYGFVDAIDRENGLSRDVLFVSDPESDDLARDTVWGLLSDTTPVIQPYFDTFSKSYRIEERL